MTAAVPLLPAGHPVDAADYDRLAYAHTQTVTSTTRPSAPFSGQLIYETDTDRLMMWHSSAATWIAVKYFGTWTGNLFRSIAAGITQGAGVFPSFSTSRDEFKLEGSECEWKFHYTGTGTTAGTAGQALYLNLPFANARNSQPTDIDGLVLVYDPSGIRYNLMPERGSDANTMAFGQDGGGGAVFAPASFTTNWQVRGTVRYRWR